MALFIFFNKMFLTTILVLFLASCLPPPGDILDSDPNNETIDNVIISLEFEHAVISNVFLIGTDNLASSGKYIYQPSSVSNTQTPSESANLEFSVHKSTYYGWVRLYAPSLNNDAVYIGIDGSMQRIFPPRIGEYVWVPLGNWSLDGTHRLSAGHAESDMKVDMFVLSNIMLNESALNSQISVIPTSDLLVYENLLDELIGFGQNTTGGQGGRLYTVTSLADSGTGTLRAALSSNEKLWIRFGVNGTIALLSPIESLSDKTIDGRGADITISGNGIYITGQRNVIINNIKIKDTSDDAIRIYNGASKVWIHHTSISNALDGAIDVTENVDEVTLSYNHIFSQDKTMLIGAGSDTGQGSNLKWTAHHNWYDRTIQRLPMLRMGKAHSYNNLFNWVSGTAMEARVSPAQLFSENDILAPINSVDHKVINIGSGASVKFEGTYKKPYSATLNIQEANRNGVFNPRDYYNYTPDVANSNLEAYIKANAGWKRVSWPQ